jgi:hypothetical protein
LALCAVELVGLVQKIGHAFDDEFEVEVGLGGGDLLADAAGHDPLQRQLLVDALPGGRRRQVVVAHGGHPVQATATSSGVAWEIRKS